MARDDAPQDGEPTPPATERHAFGIADPEQFARNLLAAFTAASEAMSRSPLQASGPAAFSHEMVEAGRTLGTVAQQWMAEPARLAMAQAQLSGDLVELWGRTYRRMLGESVEPVAVADPGDTRFSDPAWTTMPVFDFCKQAYLLTARWAQEMVDGAPGIAATDQRRAQFYLNQVTAALSPSNFPLTNPQVLDATLSSSAANLVAGMKLLAEDLARGGELFRVKQTDLAAFEVGRNLATTPGKVVFQNAVMQLIQYAPATATVMKLPLVIVPPWINKFYILDLVPQKSFVAWLVAQGFTVFVVSWVNPDERHAGYGFDTYLNEGVLAAVGAAIEATGEPRVNALGYCIGGTLLASALAAMAAHGDDRIAVASFLTTQVDFTDAGDLMTFTGEEQLRHIENLMSGKGYLDGSRMATVFNMLRPRDLIWPYVVNNYLLGKQPFPFDLLYWNSDTTRVASSNHSFYLRQFYQANALARGALNLCGALLDLGRVTMPIYHVATRDDHIAPAPSVFAGAKLFGGPVRFVLAGSGHIAGIINPPERQKYNFWASSEPAVRDVPSVDAWVAQATEVAGSWWPDYASWLSSHSGEQVAARAPGSGRLGVVEDAPGSYVRG